MTRYWIATERLLAALILVTSFALAAPAGAQGSGAAAEALFDEGKQLMDAGRYAEACVKLAESVRLDRAGGALLNLALCHEKEGKTATAWSEFKEALALARAEKRPEREKFAQDHIAALEPTLSRLTIQLAAGAEVPDLTITRNGESLSVAIIGTALPVDPGSHEISAEAPGYQAWSTTIEVAAGAAASTVSIPALEKAPEAPVAAPAPTPEAGPKPVVPADEPTSDGSTQRVLGFVAGGLGLAGTIVGAVFGGRAISLNSEADDKCGNEEGACVDAEGFDAWEDAKTSATLSNVFIGAGVGLMAVGAVLLLTAPSGDSAEDTAVLVLPEASPDGAGLSMRLRW